MTDDHSTFTYQIVNAAPAASGTARFAGNTVVFTPAADWNGATSMTYRAQDPSGAWANKDDRFMEGDPSIVTSYALLALAAG